MEGWPVVFGGNERGGAVAALASAVFGDGLPQVTSVDVGPEVGGEVELGVGGVPGEEVGGALPVRQSRSTSGMSG